jgi:hypothetical protein
MFGRGFAGVFLLLVLLVSCSDSLVCRDQDTNKVYGAWPLPQGAEFSIEFIHSVNQSPDIDVFTNDRGCILPVKTIYYAFDAGMPDDLGPDLHLAYAADGAMVVTGFRKPFNELRYIVGTVSDHTLSIGGREISLRGLCGRNAHVKFTIEQRRKRSVDDRKNEKKK